MAPAQEVKVEGTLHRRLSRVCILGGPAAVLPIYLPARLTFHNPNSVTKDLVGECRRRQSGKKNQVHYKKKFFIEE